MILKSLLWCAALAAAHPATATAPTQQLPVSGDNGGMGGIFGIGLDVVTMPMSVVPGFLYSGPEAPKSNELGDTGHGTGPYPASWREDPGLPGQTIYAPTKPPPSRVKLPVIVWGNGGCINRGTPFSNFLTEIASHGYIVIANGPASGFATPVASVGQQKRSLDWILAGNVTKYGSVDVNKVVAAGQSCGGLEAYSTSYHDARVKQTMIFNVGVFTNTRRYLIKELKSPVAWFIGGEGDPVFRFAVQDYNLLSPGVPALFASLDTGHMGTYFAKNGGQFGRAALAYLDWQLHGNKTAKELFTNPALPQSFVAHHWNVTMKNY